VTERKDSPVTERKDGPVTDAKTTAAGHPGLAGGPIYLDYNATTPVDPRAAEAALPYLATHFGNPSSAHNYAAQPQRAVAGAREAVAALIGAAPGEIVFTAGGSEARCSSALVGRARRLAQCWIWPVALRPPGLGAQLLGGAHDQRL
jgi:selenocysteine lyase/cysteine desulfurase